MQKRETKNSKRKKKDADRQTLPVAEYCQSQCSRSPLPTDIGTAVAIVKRRAVTSAIRLARALTSSRVGGGLRIIMSYQNVTHQHKGVEVACYPSRLYGGPVPSHQPPRVHKKIHRFVVLVRSKFVPSCIIKKSKVEKVDQWESSCPFRDVVLERIPTGLCCIGFLQRKKKKKKEFETEIFF